MQKKLEFIEEGVSNWSVENVRSTDYAADCKLGRVYYNALILESVMGGNPALFPAVCRAIVESGKHEGIEAGFFQAMRDDILLDRVFP